jgi:ribulose-phosphate 3-epimerase
MMPKLDELTRYLQTQGLSPLIQVDGGVTVETLPQALRHGANAFVAGSSVFGHGIPEDNITALRLAAKQGEA